MHARAPRGGPTVGVRAPDRRAVASRHGTGVPRASRRGRLLDGRMRRRDGRAGGRLGHHPLARASAAACADGARPARRRSMAPLGRRAPGDRRARARPGLSRTAHLRAPLEPIVTTPVVEDADRTEQASTFKPYVPASASLPELTPLAIGLGIVLS